MAIKKTVIIEVETQDVDKAKKSLDQLSTSIDTAETNANIRVDVDAVQIDTAKVSLDQMSTSLDSASTKANKTSSSLRNVADNGGAISVLDRITGGLATQLRDGWEASKLFNGSLKKMKGALIASGIGLFVVALSLIVTYWAEIKDFIQGTTRSLEAQMRAYDRLTVKIDHQLSLNKLNQQILKKQGKSTEKLVGLENDLLLKKQEVTKNSLINLKAQLEIENSKIREVGLLEKGLIHLKGYVLGYAGIASDVAKATGIDIVSDLQSQIKELEIKAAEVELALLGDEPDVVEDTKDEKIVFDDSAQKKIEDEILALEEINRIRKEFAEKNRDDKLGQNELDRQDKLLEIENNVTDEVFKRQALLEVNKFYDDQEAKIKAEAFAAEKAADAELLKAKLEGYDKVKEGIQSVSNLTSDIFSIADNLGKKDEKSKDKRARANFAVQKVMNLSLAGIDAVKSIQASLAQSPIAIGPVPNPAGIASLAFASLTGAATVAKIATAKFKGGISGAGGGGEPPSITSPAFNLVEGTADNQINDSINLGNQEPVQAYVVSGDVTTAQNLDNNIITESGL